MTQIGQLDQIPRMRFGHVPTPLESAPRLTSANGGAEIWVKRDDCTGVAMGGNKSRQLEFYMGAAREAGADTILITGAVQSNFVRMAAACARLAGMDIHIQLEERVAEADPLYRSSGNVLLDRLFGATLHAYPDGEDEAGADRQLEEIAADLRARGCKPYVIHLSPSHPPLGALGYVDAARELVAQLSEARIEIDAFVLPSGSGASHSGFLFGLRALGVTTPVTGICVRREIALQTPRILNRCHALADLLAIPSPVSEADVITDDRWFPPGYGKFGEDVLEAMRLAARTEALILDPVYTGKAMAGALSIARTSGAGSRVLFIHTGGTPGVFAYGDAIL